MPLILAMTTPNSWILFFITSFGHLHATGFLTGVGNIRSWTWEHLYRENVSAH